jgi:hypothetical protein
LQGGGHAQACARAVNQFFGLWRDAEWQDQPAPDGARTEKGTTMTARTFALACLALLPATAFAQTAPCADHATVMARLATGYGESRQAIAIGANNTVVEIYASLETGTWTIAVTSAGGPTCLVASGHSFELLAEALPNTDPGA